MWILVVLAAVVAYLAGSRRRPTLAPESKVFGLKEAQAARSYVTDPTHAKTVKAVVVGVLGYQDAVANQVAGEVHGLERAKASNLARSSDYEKEIAALRAKILSLSGANQQVDASIADLQVLGNMFA